MPSEALEDFGITAMDEAAIDACLERNSTAVLGIPTQGPPYLLPLSYGYDGGDRLYFSFLEGDDSTKAGLVDGEVPVQALVLRVDSAVTWDSVQLTGTLSPVSESEREKATACMENAWRPAVLEQIEDDAAVSLYALEVSERSGLRHTGLPAGFPGSENG